MSVSVSAGVRTAIRNFAEIDRQGMKKPFFGFFGGVSKFEDLVNARYKLKKAVLTNPKVGQLLLSMEGVTKVKDYMTRKLIGFTEKANPNQTRFLAPKEEQHVKKVFARFVGAYLRLATDPKAEALFKAHADARKAMKEALVKQLDATAQALNLPRTDQKVFAAAGKAIDETVKDYPATTRDYLQYKLSYMRAFDPSFSSSFLQRMLFRA